MAPILAWATARLREPSTYAGLGLLLTHYGLHPTDPQLGAIIQVLTDLASLAAVAFPEGTMAEGAR